MLDLQVFKLIFDVGSLSHLLSIYPYVVKIQSFCRGVPDFPSSKYNLNIFHII